MDAATGKIIATIPIGEGCDGIIFIPGDRNIVSSNGAGTLTVINQSGPGDYKVIQTLPTRKGARTITYDETTGRIYLPTADVTMDNGKRSIVPGSFRILIVTKE